MNTNQGNLDDVSLCRLSALQGDATAQSLLAIRCLSGDGVPQDCEEAAKWHRLAAEQRISTSDIQNIKELAEQGDANAQYQLGWTYFSGEDGAEENGYLAEYWFLKAALQGHPKGMWRIGSSYEQCDDEQACIWYIKSAEAGYSFAQYWVGVKFNRGEGVIQDDQQAILWYLRAAEQNEPCAFEALGDCYERGIGVGQNWQQSAYWYKRAAIRYRELYREEATKEMRGVTV